MEEKKKHKKCEGCGEFKLLNEGGDDSLSLCNKCKALFEEMMGEGAE